MLRRILQECWLIDLVQSGPLCARTPDHSTEPISTIQRSIIPVTTPKAQSRVANEHSLLEISNFKIHKSTWSVESSYFANSPPSHKTREWRFCRLLWSGIHRSWHYFCLGNCRWCIDPVSAIKTALTIHEDGDCGKSNLVDVWVIIVLGLGFNIIIILLLEERDDQGPLMLYWFQVTSRVSP